MILNYETKGLSNDKISKKTINFYFFIMNKNHLNCNTLYQYFSYFYPLFNLLYIFLQRSYFKNKIVSVLRKARSYLFDSQTYV
jgi:hypothetical protein